MASTAAARFVALLSLVVLSGCSSKAGTGALLGGLGGALVGGAIGSDSANAGKGALIGGAIGAVGGALVGNEMDKSDREAERRMMEQSRYNDASAGSGRSFAASNYVTKEDVIAWSARGVREEIIIDRIERSNTVFRLTAADENQMRDAGVGEPVIQAMRGTALR